jgi:hypothetical protein
MQGARLKAAFRAKSRRDGILVRKILSDAAQAHPTHYPLPRSATGCYDFFHDSRA